jgi:hypothetical protein
MLKFSGLLKYSGVLHWYQVFGHPLCADFMDPMIAANSYTDILLLLSTPS